jgi:hypothetical protein
MLPPGAEKLPLPEPEAGMNEQATSRSRSSTSKT